MATAAREGGNAHLPQRLIRSPAAWRRPENVSRGALQLVNQVGSRFLTLCKPERRLENVGNRGRFKQHQLIPYPLMFQYEHAHIYNDLHIFMEALPYR